MPSRREAPVEWDDGRGSTRPLVAHGETRPETFLQGLMECAPHDEPELSRSELRPLRDVLQDAIESVLTPREQWVFDGYFIRRRSLRQLGRELSSSKSLVAKIRDIAIQKLREELECEPAIATYLKGKQ